MDETELNAIALRALGDQIQAIVQSANVPIAGIVVIAQNGAVEVRSSIDSETMKEVLAEIAKNFEG